MHFLGRYAISLAVNCQGNVLFSWRFSKTAKESSHFLGDSLKPPSKYAIYLAVIISSQEITFLTVYLHRQVKYSFLGGCILAAKETYGRQGNSSLW